LLCWMSLLVSVCMCRVLPAASMMLSLLQIRYQIRALHGAALIQVRVESVFPIPGSMSC
jgi:hypothetical protein